MYLPVTYSSRWTESLRVNWLIKRKSRENRFATRVNYQPRITSPLNSFTSRDATREFRIRSQCCAGQSRIESDALEGSLGTHSNQSHDPGAPCSNNSRTLSTIYRDIGAASEQNRRSKYSATFSQAVSVVTGNPESTVNRCGSDCSRGTRLLVNMPIERPILI